MRDSQRPRLRDIIRATAEVTGLSMHQIIGDRRFRELSKARWLVCSIATKHGYSKCRIGSELGQYDHTSVVNGLARLERALAAGNTAFPQLLDEIEARATVLSDTARKSLRGDLPADAKAPAYEAHGIERLHVRKSRAKPKPQRKPVKTVARIPTPEGDYGAWVRWHLNGSEAALRKALQAQRRVA